MTATYNLPRMALDGNTIGFRTLIFGSGYTGLGIRSTPGRPDKAWHNHGLKID